MASHEFPVAVIGMAVKLPGADNCDEFWNLMVNKGDTVATFPQERASDVQHVLPTFKGQFIDENNPFFTGSFFKSVDRFDADFFGINRKEALFIEPEQRMFLETVWELLEDAGYASRIKNSNTGVYVGNTVNKYKYILTENHPSISHGNHSPFISSRVSYTFNLSGPAMMVATGCSSSLLAVHLACQGLLSGDCNMAIAGGITLDLLPISLKTDIWNQLGITSPNAKCRTFDVNAKGIAKAEGCGIVLLKPLGKAIADGDNIYGVLEATTANQDGHSQGITAPHPGAQANMLIRAWELANITPDMLGYIEAHGTGTELGDPIEIMGITRAYQKMTTKTVSKNERIPIGSVKANIGHLADGAAGVVSLIKVLLCMKMKRIPPVTNFSTPNPHINWDKAPVVVNETMRKWEPEYEKQRYGGVSAFGLLGTNIHAVVKEYKEQTKVSWPVACVNPHLLCIAAKKRKSLVAFISKLLNFFERHSKMSYEDFASICFTINSGREQHKYPNRIAFVSKDAEELKQALNKIKEATCPYEEQKIPEAVKSSQPTSQQAAVMNRFLSGDPVDWDKYYASTESSLRRRIGFLPTYSFENVRYWPEVSAPLNKQYLIVEHQIPNHNEEQTTTDEVSKSVTKTMISNHKSKQEIFKILSSAFDDALGEQFNWQVEGNTNLFDLGVDSLVYTQLTMRLYEDFQDKSDIIFSQTDLYSHPTFNELCQFLEEKINRSQISDKDIVLSAAGVDCNNIDHAEKMPLSFSQRRLWVIEKMEKAGSTYNATNCIKISGQLNMEAFRTSVNNVLGRHDVFFARVIEEAGEPMIDYNWNVNVELEEIDLTGQCKCPEDKAMELFDDDYRTPFSLSEGPLARVKLYRLGAAQNLFTMVIHHIIFDGWSHFLFYNELWDNYRKSTDERTLSVQMHKPISSIFSKWEKEESLMMNSKMQRDIDYWLQKLSGPLPITTFPGDKKRPQIFSYQGGRLTRFIDMGVFNSLNKSVDEPHTMFHSIVAAVFVLIQFFNPSDTDFVVGIPVTGRNDIRMKDVIGCFINTLVLRHSMNKAMPYSQILKSVVKTCVEAQEHQQAPFDHLVSKLKLPRNTSISPVFSINICYHNEELKQDHVDPPKMLQVERKLLHNDTSKWDIQFDFLEEGGQMRFTLEYYKGAFSENYANTIADLFHQTLEIIAKSPDVALSDISIGKPAIMRGATVPLGDRSLTEALIESIDKHPTSTIEDIFGRLFKYSTLKREAEQFANFFTKVCNLRKGNRVGLLFENSYEGLRVIIACLLVGIVYVPLNTENPKARLEQIVRSSGLKCICFSKTAFNLATYLQWSCEDVGNILCIDGDNIRNSLETQDNPLMDTELWNCVAEEASTDIEGGGWKSSFTGEHMSVEEIEDYVSNVSSKLEKHVDNKSSVLEIGCASGLTTHALCHKVKRYVATDLSQMMIEKIREKKLKNVSTICIPAHEIEDTFKNQKFNLIIINSVVHCFPGYNYLRKVLEMSEKVLADDGKIFVGDVMDLRKREDLQHALRAFKAANPNYRTKTDLSAELFVPREFFESFRDVFPSIACTQKYCRVENELTKYRYDVLMKKGDEEGTKTQSIEKEILSMNDVECCNGLNENLLAEKVHPGDDAYILFTSGTTGTPKGVRISQKALLNYSEWASSTYGLNTNSIMPLFSPLTFDFTVTSIIPPLLAGSNIKIFKPFAESYEDIAKDESLTIAKFSPLQLEVILSSASKPLGMEVYILGGEELMYPLLVKLKENKQEKPFKVWNEYGPTEATVGCIVSCIHDTEIIALHDSYIPIGQPINNVTVAVVDCAKPVSLGTKGHLAIGGICLTSGFVQQRKENEDAFKSACWNQDGSLMYITTDIVSCSVDKSEMFYFGRDNTDIVKINEMRVDISEIQSSIRSLNFVEDSWVCTYEMDGSVFLGAAVKLLDGIRYSEEDLKISITKELTEILPLNCIPKVILKLTNAPRNKNGKKDTAFLRSLFINSIEKSETDNSLPNETEEKVQKLWLEILPIKRIPGLNEDFFFELSGDSLQAIHLVRKMRNAGFSVSVNDIFRNPTIKSLCESLHSKNSEIYRREKTDTKDIPFRPTPIAENYIRTKRQSDRYAVPALLELRNPLTTDVMKEALRAVICKHRSLSSRFFMENGKVFQQYINIGIKPELFQARLSEKVTHIAEDPIFTDTCKTLEDELDINKGNLLNAALLTSDTKQYCLIVVHHITVDIVSWQQILDDLAIVLKQITSGKPPNLSPAITSFDKYCAKLWKDVDTCSVEEIKYWETLTKNYKDTDIFNKAPEESLYRDAKWESESIHADIVRKLSIAIESTDEAVILTALGQAFSKLEGTSLTVCLDRHGRHLDLDTTDTVGWCTSMFPFTIDTRSSDEFITATRKVRKDMQQIPFHGIRYGPLVGVGKVNSELPSTMFVFQGSLDASSKEAFNAGDASFKYLPWIEVLTNDLENGKFHRDGSDRLDFPLQVLCWFHSDHLRIGCLFDSKKISGKWAQALLGSMRVRLLSEIKRFSPETLLTKHGSDSTDDGVQNLNHKPVTSKSVQIISNFTITPDTISFVRRVLQAQGFGNIEIFVAETSDFYHVLMQNKSSKYTLTMAIVKCENQKQGEEIKMALQTFESHNKGTGSAVCSLCLNSNSYLTPFRSGKGRCRLEDTIDIQHDEFDTLTDANFNMPLTQRGYMKLAIAISRRIIATFRRTDIKVICVDGDYTLWDGECANSDVKITQTYKQFQTFLQQKMKEGYLLVLLSKNRLEDINAVLDKDDMVLKEEYFVHLAANWNPKHVNIASVSRLLDLSLDSFLFIDDSAAECEEMLRVYPEVKTLRYPSDENLSDVFTSCLWILDTFEVTSEAASRTAMYRSEVSRMAVGDRHLTKQTCNPPQDFLDLLKTWKMKLYLWKSKVRDLRSDPNILKRVNELLHRTNQFKLNDLYIHIDHFVNEDECIVVSLEDKYGGYGIISVIMMEHGADKSKLKQWVMSCRALGRMVERRLLVEIFASNFQRNKELQLCYKETSKNIPMQNFMEVLIHNKEVTGNVVLNRNRILDRNTDLHEVILTDDQSDLTLTNSKTTKYLPAYNSSFVSSLFTKLEKLKGWLFNNLSMEHIDHILRNSTLPCFLLDSKLDELYSTNSMGDDICTLEEIWKRILQTDSLPDSNDNFVKQGGNSFQAVFFIAEILSKFGVNLELIDVLTKPFKWLETSILTVKAEPSNAEITGGPKDAIQLSQAQKRMWLLQNSVKGSTAYTETLAIKIDSNDSAQRILPHVFKAHPILLATLDKSANSLQFKRQKASISERYLDSDRNLEEEISSSKPVFDKTEDTLSQFLVFRNKNITVLVLHVHHILVDDITLHNIKLSVRRYTETEQRVFKPAHNLVVLEKEYMESAVYESDKFYWERVFEECPEETAFGLKQSSTVNEVLPQKGKLLTSLLPLENSQQLQKKCTEYGVTEFQYLLACFVVVVHRYTGKEEITIAIPVSTRNSENIDADGLFVNTVLFRHRIRFDLTLQEHVKFVAEEWLRSFSHSRYPVDHIGQIIWDRFGKSLSSVCNVMFNFATFDMEENELIVTPKHAKMSFSLDVFKGKNGMKLVCEYAAEQIMDESAGNVLGALVQLIRNGVINEFSKLRDIEFLTGAELMLIDSFSKTKGPSLPCEHVFDMFTRNAKTSPQSTAVCFKELRLSYGELMEMVGKIAARVLEVQEPNTLKTKHVVIYMDKTDKAVAAMLAVWQLGGVFIPVSTKYCSNIYEIIESLNPCVVLVDLSLEKKIYGNYNVINIRDIDFCSSSGVKLHQKVTLDIDSPAYTIRTSGSTGKPKEITISHKGLAILAGAWKSAYKMDEYEVSLLQWAPLSFDVFIGDIVRGLCCGVGKIVLCPDDMRLDTDHIASLLAEENITIAEVTPQFGLLLTQRATGQQLKSLNVFILGSDILQKEVYNKIKSRLNPRQRLLNSYGMTEATIDSSFFEGEKIPNTRGGAVPIGKPLPGVTMRVLDPNTLRCCPIGTVGELFIGGGVLGSGGVDIVETCGERLLKTNDLAGWLQTGDLELCGRKDTMCKLRGFRIDCSFIENMILKYCSDITDVSVSVLIDAKRQKNEYLCAFVVQVNEQETENTDTVKRTIQKVLPYYMIPDFIESVDKIPLTQNGKVDKRRLPSLETMMKRRLDNDGRKQTVHPVSKVLAELFAETLNVESSMIDYDRTFMEQGGHSLILMKFSLLIKDKTTLNVSIVDIFSYPSIKLLTARATSHLEYGIINKTASNAYVNCKNEKRPYDVAICGIGVRLPNNVRSITEFWELLENQTDLVTKFPNHRKEDILNCVNPELLNTLREADEFKGAFLNDIDMFDRDAFNISSAEARLMAPEQRMFLEVASETLAQGTNLSEIEGSETGVFLSQADIGYSKLSHPDEATSISGLMPGMIATRVAYHYNLKGPTMMIDTACSSGISAMKAACISLQRGECKAALVGGMNIVFYPSRTGVYGNNGILSSDFTCRPFDENANGTSVGEGIICFYLEPLDEALKQNKHVYGVIKSIGTNNVGTGNGITAPTVQSQENVIRSALSQANISENDVSFIEAHGTGTVLGDKIELSALGNVFGSRGSERRLPIGSVKSNLGHLDYAAGLAGLLKVITGYMFQTIPATVNFESPHNELTNLPLYVPTKLETWKSSMTFRRIAGLSSFGLTGTNTHMILSDSIQGRREPKSDIALPLLLCGDTHEHIKKQAVLYESLINQTIVKHEINTVQDVSMSILVKLHQLQTSGRLQSNYRVAIMESDPKKLLLDLALIRNCKDGESLASKSEGRIVSAHSGFTIKEDNCRHFSQALKDFLMFSKINVKSFTGNTKVNQSFCAPGVVLSIFNPKRHWLRPCVKTPRNYLSLIDIIHGKIGNTQELVRTLDLSPSSDLLEYEARFCCSIILNFLLETGLKTEIDSEDDIRFEESFAKTGMEEKYDKLFFIMIRELLNYKLVEAKGSDPERLGLDVFRFNCRGVVLQSPKQIAEEAVVKYPQWADCFRFPLHCSKHLKHVLWGHMSPLTVIYPQGDLNFMYQFDKLGDLLGDVYYNMYMQIIVEYAAKLSSRGRTVRILEVGAGMGHVTRQLLPSLSEIADIEYWFTDLGRAFVENAKTLFENYASMMRFSTFDITKNAVKQGLLGSYDIVISYNVIHTTESISKSVNNLKTCLGKDGTLFIIESAKNETWATLAWGILDGWWYFKDYDLRPYEPMLEPEKWEHVLQRSGFGSVHSFPTDADERKHVEKFLFVCSSKQKEAEHIPAPKDGWWKCIDLTVHRHADFDTDSSGGESGIGEEDKVSRSLVKSELKKIWCELLDLDEINDDEDFNALGGESLLAIQMMTMVRRRIGYQLEIADTFCYTSLGSLSDYISDQLEAEASQQSSSESSANTSDSESNPQADLSHILEETDKRTTGCILMFPGQGSQKVGMCKSMKDSESAKEVFKLAEDILGINILDICSGPEDVLKEKLKSTEFVQVALFVSCLAKIAQLRKESPEILNSVTHVAGLSVGEFTAMVYANVIRFEDALILVQKRGRAMEKEVEKASTAMASVLGPSGKELDGFLKQNLPRTVISTYLADNQHTVAGTENDIDSLISILTEDNQSNFGVIDVRRLRVAGAFHSSHMVEAEHEIRPLIDQISFRRPEISLIMNVTGETCDDPETIKKLVSRQIVESVKWKETIVSAHNAGVRRFIEVAPARVLSSIVKTRIEVCKGCAGELIMV